MNQCNQPEEESKSKPRRKEAHGEDEQHVSPFHVQQCGEDILKVLQPSCFDAPRADITLARLCHDPSSTLCDRHISR